MAALYKPLGLFEHDVGYLDVPRSGFVKGGGDDFRADGTSHVGDFLGALVDEKHHEVGLGMVLSDGVSNVLEQQGLSGLGLCHNECALSLTNRGKEVYDAPREAVAVPGTEAELLVGEKRGEMFEGDAVAHFDGATAVDSLRLDEDEELLALVGHFHPSLDDVAGLEVVAADEGCLDVDVVGRGEVVVIGRAQEAVAVGEGFKHTASREQIGFLGNLGLGGWCVARGSGQAALSDMISVGFLSAVFAVLSLYAKASLHLGIFVELAEFHPGCGRRVGIAVVGIYGGGANCGDVVDDDEVGLCLLAHAVWRLDVLGQERCGRWCGGRVLGPVHAAGHLVLGLIHAGGLCVEGSHLLHNEVGQVLSVLGGRSR